MSERAEPVLEVHDLCVRAEASGRDVLNQLSLELHAGRIAAIVGETGSGKSTLLNAILGLLPDGLRHTRGQIGLATGPGSSRTDLLSLTAAGRRRYLGTEIGFVPQETRSGMNPLMSARAFVIEAARRGGALARERASDAMRQAGLSESFVRQDADRRPGRLSGGQCQRVLIAQAIVNRPRLLLLDEPTASLDPATRHEVRETIRQLARDDCAIALVTHDLGSLPALAQDIHVLYLGQIVESGPAERVLARPLHPYTRGLLGCVPRLKHAVPLRPIRGEIGQAGAGAGCPFQPRCADAIARCQTDVPALAAFDDQRKVACHVVAP